MNSVISGVQVFEQNSPPMGGCNPRDNMPFTIAIRLEGEFPDGSMTILIHSLDMLLPGNWTITWAP
jgi:hypothetical protein